MKNKKKTEIPEDVKRFVATAELRQVFLKGSYADCFVPPGAVVAEETEPEFKTESSFRRQNEKLLIVFNKLTLGGKSKKSRVFEFQQVMGLVYECDHKSFSDNVLKFFAEKNGTYNAWPYHRELLQSTMSRMGIPVFILPLLNPYRFAAMSKPAKSVKKGKASGKLKVMSGSK